MDTKVKKYTKYTDVRKNAIRDEQNFDGKTISADIVSNRRKIASKMALKYNITPEILAEFFQIPMKIVKKDIEEANIEFKGTRRFKINKEKNAMRDHIVEEISKGTDKQEALAIFGMWSDVVLFGEEVKVSFRGLNSEQLSRMQKALDLCGYGYSQADIMSISKITRVERELVKTQLEEGVSFKKGLGGGTSLNGAMEFAQDRFQKGEDSKDINKATGVPVVALEKTNYDKYKENNRDNSRNKYQRKDGKENISYKDASKEQLKEEVYQRWTNRECTQQELAEELGVTRITIMNWCREMKAKHMNERPEMAIRQRNVKREKREEREDKKEKVVSLYLLYKEDGLSHSKTINKICDEMKLQYMQVLDFLREKGLVATKFENNPSLESVKKEEKHFKDGYDMGVMAHFGYGPNAGKTGYSVDETGKVSINKEYAEVVMGQRQVSYEIANEPAFTSHIRENDGIIGDYWKQKKQKKNEEKVSNKTFGNAKHREAEREKDIGIEKEDDKIL